MPTKKTYVALHHRRHGTDLYLYSHTPNESKSLTAEYQDTIFVGKSLVRALGIKLDHEENEYIESFEINLDDMIDLDETIEKICKK